MNIPLIPARDFDFSPYGVYYDLVRDPILMRHTHTEAYEDHMTDRPLIDTLGHLGYTIGAASPYTVASMEKHDHTQEAIFCMQNP